MDLLNLLKLLPVVGPVVARAGDFIDWYHQAADMLDPADQDTAKAALSDLQAENDEGHARFQAKLQAAAERD